MVGGGQEILHWPKLYSDVGVQASACDDRRGVLQVIESVQKISLD